MLALHRRCCMAGAEVQRPVGTGSLQGCRAEAWHSGCVWNLAEEESSWRWGSSCFLGVGRAEQPEEKAGRRTPRRDHGGHHNILMFVSFIAWRGSREDQ